MGWAVDLVDMHTWPDFTWLGCDGLGWGRLVIGWGLEILLGWRVGWI